MTKRLVENAFFVIVALALVYSVVRVLTGCRGAVVHYPPDGRDADYQVTVVATDAPYDAAPAPDCRMACQVLRNFNCPEGEDVDGGDTCEGLCFKAEATGIFDLHEACVAKALTKDQVRACGVRCQ